MCTLCSPPPIVCLVNFDSVFFMEPSRRGWAPWHMLLIPALCDGGRQIFELADPVYIENSNSQGYIGRPCLKDTNDVLEFGIQL